MTTFKAANLIYRTGAKRPISTDGALSRYLNAVASLPFCNHSGSKPHYWTSLLLFLFLIQLACSSNDNAHTTATTLVQPPPHQVLTIVRGDLYARVLSPCETESPTKPAECVGVDPQKPLLVFDLPNGKSFRLGEVVSINFAVRNAKLRANGGDLRVRYIIDDEDAQWRDWDEPFGLAGWVPGKHTIRLELIGPDGWPYKNGNQNIVTREINVEPN
ncbi:MAG TPA: hypothetical protein VIG25_08135 [Pyrinomonadaceae bacterium]